jgi:hypothetical protein
MEMKRPSMWKGYPEINSRGGLAWLLTFCAASTKSVITFYCYVQWTLGFLHWKIDFKTVRWSTHSAPYLLGFKSYDQISMQVRTCPNWLSELICRTCPNWTCWFILGPNWSTWFFFFASSPCIAAAPLSHIYLSTTNVEHLGSITFSDMLKLISDRRELTSCCSFLALLRVIGP